MQNMFYFYFGNNFTDGNALCCGVSSEQRCPLGQRDGTSEQRVSTRLRWWLPPRWSPHTATARPVKREGTLSACTPSQAWLDLQSSCPCRGRSWRGADRCALQLRECSSQIESPLGSTLTLPHRRGGRPVSIIVVGGQVFDITGGPPNMYTVVYIHRVYK